MDGLDTLGGLRSFYPADLVSRQEAAGLGGPKETARVAARFEGMFWSLLIKEMREGLEPGVMLGEDAGDVLGGLFDQTLGEHLAEGHALGIAAMIQRQLAKTKNDAKQTEKPGGPRQTVGPVSRPS